ncbi:hypothetical protein B0H13DRAFT_1927504 [Mycena leptocephala]|nr:hypothetical protein B0H13DRAFT_1927504 [Mycena leptocephala]
MPLQDASRLQTSRRPKSPQHFKISSPPQDVNTLRPQEASMPPPQRPTPQELMTIKTPQYFIFRSNAQDANHHFKPLRTPSKPRATPQELETRQYSSMLQVLLRLTPDPSRLDNFKPPRDFKRLKTSRHVKASIQTSRLSLRLPPIQRRQAAQDSQDSRRRRLGESSRTDSRVKLNRRPSKVGPQDTSRVKLVNLKTIQDLSGTTAQDASKIKNRTSRSSRGVVDLESQLILNPSRWRSQESNTASLQDDLSRWSAFKTPNLKTVTQDFHCPRIPQSIKTPELQASQDASGASRPQDASRSSNASSVLTSSGPAQHFKLQDILKTFEINTPKSSTLNLKMLYSSTDFKPPRDASRLKTFKPLQDFKLQASIHLKTLEAAQVLRLLNPLSPP